MQLDLIGEEISNRRHLALLYRELLGGIPGIEVPADIPETESTYSYFPVVVDEARFGMTRDMLFGLLRQCNVVARKYFYPLISEASCYSALPSAVESICRWRSAFQTGALPADLSIARTADRAADRRDHF